MCIISYKGTVGVTLTQSLCDGASYEAEPDETAGELFVFHSVRSFLKVRLTAVWCPERNIAL